MDPQLALTMNQQHQGSDKSLLNEMNQNCRICNRHIGRATAMEQHLISHENDRQIFCYVCKNSYYQLHVFQKHFQTNHPNHELRLAAYEKTHSQCFVCDENVANFLELKDHLASHKVFSCKKCKTTFVKWQSLESHYHKYHPKGQWSGYFECPTCDRTFTVLQSMINHRTHCKKN